MKKALALGIMGSFFFAFTFILNRSINLSGGHWLWSAALRYLFSFPILFVLLIRGHEYRPVFTDIKRKPMQWILWSTVGFGLFYTMLSAASVYAESWFTASAWQVTIVAGVLLTPLFRMKIPVKNLLFSSIILIGIFIMQVPKMQQSRWEKLVLPFLIILIAAFAYPLGNRKMMEVCENKLSVIQRIFGMTLCSMPFWILVTVAAYLRVGFPSEGQIIQSVGVALFSGVIATVLFFRATELVKGDPNQLAVIEATQSGEVIFTLILGVLLLNDSMPDAISFVGILFVIGGMVLNSLVSVRER